MSIKNKKGDVNQVFVIIFSVIVIVFAGFLVVKFIAAFTTDFDDHVQKSFYDNFEKNYNTVYTTYGSEKIYDYKVPSEVRMICFVSDASKIATMQTKNGESPYDSRSTEIEEIEMLYDTDDNVFIFDDGALKSSKNLKSYKTETGAFCVEPMGNSFSLVLENRQNQVYVIDNN